MKRHRLDDFLAVGRKFDAYWYLKAAERLGQLLVERSGLGVGIRLSQMSGMILLRTFVLS